MLRGLAGKLSESLTAAVLAPEHKTISDPREVSSRFRREQCRGAVLCNTNVPGQWAEEQKTRALWQRDAVRASGVLL